METNITTLEAARLKHPKVGSLFGRWGAHEAIERDSKEGDYSAADVSSNALQRARNLTGPRNIGVRSRTMLAVQQTHGNRAIQRFMQSTPRTISVQRWDYGDGYGYEWDPTHPSGGGGYESSSDGGQQSESGYGYEMGGDWDPSYPGGGGGSYDSSSGGGYEEGYGYEMGGGFDPMFPSTDGGYSGGSSSEAGGGSYEEGYGYEFGGSRAPGDWPPSEMF